MLMADGLNNVRALRLAEVVQDFRNLQVYLTQIDYEPTSPEEYWGDGYTILRQCVEDAQSLLKDPYEPEAPEANGDQEREKQQLQRVILDASSRRFKAQKLYLSATAAIRWIQSRNAILRNARSNDTQSGQLQAVDDRLVQELNAITDQMVLEQLKAQDEQQGKWINEDPPLAQILHWIAVH